MTSWCKTRNHLSSRCNVCLVCVRASCAVGVEVLAIVVTIYHRIAHYSTLRYTIARHRTLQDTTAHYRTLQNTTERYRMLQNQYYGTPRETTALTSLFLSFCCSLSGVVVKERRNNFDFWSSHQHRREGFGRR